MIHKPHWRGISFIAILQNSYQIMITHRMINIIAHVSQAVPIRLWETYVSSEGTHNL